MTSYKDAIVLLNDLEEFADTHEFPEAENLIAKAREALEKDLNGMLLPTRRSAKSPRLYPFQ